MEKILQDLRYGFRMLRRSPGFTAVAVLSLALGIGACTAIFSVVYGVLIRPLPYPKPEQVMLVFQVNSPGGRTQTSDVNFNDLKEQNHSFQALAQFSGQIVSVSGGSEPSRARAGAVSQEFFDAVGVKPAIGRTFLPEELSEGASPAVLVSYGYWQRYLSGDRNLTDKRLTFLSRVHSIVGVMPRGFSFPTGSELWIPREQFPRLPSRTAHNWQVIGRLAEGITLEQARADLSMIARRLKQQYGDDTWMVDAAVVPLQEAIVGPVRLRLLVLLGAVGFLLLVACANVTNLLLARAASRQKELAVRVALGAGRGGLVRQFLMESLVLSLLGGALGVLAAVWGVDTLLALEPGKLPRLDEIGVNSVILAFALSVSVLCAVGLGLLTALQSTRQNLQDALKESQRIQAGGSSHRWRGALVISQVAITLVLLVGAGLLGHTLLRLLAIDPGFRVERGVVIDLSHTDPQNTQERASLVRFYDELFTRLRRIPGVEGVGGVNVFPLSGGSGADGTFLIAGNEQIRNFEQFGQLARNPERTGYAQFRVASDGYFRVMGIPLVRGRLFDERDAPDAPHVAVISESLARQRWPKQDPIGKRIQYGNMDGDLRLFMIVGIVGDIRELGLDSEPRPTFYAFSRQRPNFRSFSIVLRVKESEPRPLGSGLSDPAMRDPLAYVRRSEFFRRTEFAAVISSARSIVRELNPSLPPRFRTLEEIFSASLADRRFSLALLGVFAGTALLLAAMGVYGVMAHAVAQRTQEIGIRMALGARPHDVLGLIVGQGLRLILSGVVAGVFGSFWLTRFMTTLLFGIKPTDAMSFAAAALVLALAALLASYIPARRATKVDPMVALRYE